MIERKPIKNPDVATVATNGSGPPTFAAVQAEIAAAMAAGELSLPQKFEWFEKKLKAALADSSVSASELAKIARETDVAIEAARQEALAARERGLDFVASPDAKAAREAIENAEFAISRLLTQRPRLEALLDARLLAEQRAAYLVRYEQLKIEGAALAQDLADLYPDAVRRIVEVFAKLAAFQQQCRVLHLSDPGDGRPHVPDPELKARGSHGFSRDQPSLLEVCAPTRLAIGQRNLAAAPRRLRRDLRRVDDRTQRRAVLGGRAGACAHRCRAAAAARAHGGALCVASGRTTRTREPCSSRKLGGLAKADLTTKEVTGLQANKEFRAVASVAARSGRHGSGSSVPSVSPFSGSFIRLEHANKAASFIAPTD